MIHFKKDDELLELRKRTAERMDAKRQEMAEQRRYLLWNYNPTVRSARQ